MAEAAANAELPLVLIVDDDPRNLVAIESTLDGANFRLVKAQSGAEAFLAMMQHDFAAIVLDVKMPDMSGIELARMIKERRRTRHIPILFLTAHYLEEEHAMLGYDVGAVDYLTKPVNPRVLRSKVNVFVDLFTKTRALAALNQTAAAAEEALRIANTELSARNAALEREASERERRIRAESAQAEAEEANAAKDRFLAMLSHELRTPLSPIVHAVSLIEEAECPPHVRDCVETIRRNVRLEARLIDDLLDLARIRNGKLRLDTESVDVHEILRHALEICRPDLEAKRLQLAVRLEALQPRVQGDPARLHQVFWNLLSNAVKFSDPEGIVSVRTSLAGDRLQIEVADQGVGIAPEALGRIFEAFEQGERSRQAGLGLGLAICKALVELHGGEIAATSDGPQRGSTFRIRLPHAPCASRPENGSNSRIETLEGLRLLVVEDHLDTLATLERLLRRHGYTVQVAPSVAKAVEIAGGFEFDVLISDIGLPDGRGTDLLARLRELRGEVPPAIALSGFGMDDDLERSRKAGFSEHLTKPVEFSALNEAIARIALRSPGRKPEAPAG